jgi:uncharacterized protein
MRPVYMEIVLAGESFYLLPQKAAYRPRKRQLVLSDVHLGKAAHFRKKGIPMPQEGHLADLDRLEYLIKTWDPDSVLILGDLFHSEYNREWLWLKSLFKSHAKREFILVEGNHDILPEPAYGIGNLLKAGLIEEDLIVFSHEPLPATRKLNICGHIHPGVRLTGKARQSITLPCFIHRGNQFVLPAFGKLTGLAIMDRVEGDAFYLVTHETVVKL